MSQINLPLEWQGQGGAGEFLLSDANSLAVAHLERWREWPLSVSVLTGPPLSGRSTLGRRFEILTGGNVIDEAEGADDHRLFHAWNDAQLHRQPLLLIGGNPPGRWPVTLPDLRSRLAAAPHVVIEEPDEPLARALIERMLAASGASFAADLPDWLLRRIDRTYVTIDAVARLLDRAALSSGRKISVAMAKEALQIAGILPIVPPDPSH